MEISVVMATYNGEKYINKQLDSICNQTVMPTEIVIVDDCSTDNTVDLIQKYIDENNKINIRLFKSETNMGVVNTFRRAIIHSKGDMVFLSDQDDYWLKNKIEIILNFFNNNKNINLVTHAYNIIDGEDNLVDKRIRPDRNSHKINLFRILKRNFFPGFTYAFRKQAYIKYINDMDERIYIHDWYLVLIGAMKDSAYYKNEILSHYRIHDNNTIGMNLKWYHLSSYSKRIDKFEERLDFLNTILNRIETIEVYSDLKDESIIPLLKQNIEFYDNRINYIKGKSLMKFLGFATMNISSYDSFRSLLGDIAMFFRKRKKQMRN